MTPPPLTADGFQEVTGVSDEVRQRLAAFVALLAKWQRRINLVGNATLTDVWRRHLLDSAQLAPLIAQGAAPVVDLGSGAGFPGLVLAIMGIPGVRLVESDGRKCAFLGEAARASGAEVEIVRARIEDLPPISAGVLTARALAPLPKLLDLTEKLISPETICLFPKGRDAQQELTDSQKNWMMKVTRIKSLTDSFGTILKLEGISRRHAH